MPDSVSMCAGNHLFWGIYQGESGGGGGSKGGILASAGGGDDVVDSDYHPCPGESNATVKRMNLKGVRGRFAW